ncbi:LOW QUALITY PROTEIN: hypothetical protein BC938DRAFT_478586 [Jimgerdemannia flammicorona]|uniref:Ubiquitin-like protease family profile domain-containing protein n=1 Tax=Jimgerdemannia flammicorona TaxID=994334 RepID=A0A433QYF0_9FUNG|nr:LOW QUALITY PROTEIN: hypothetical protein BC938DRAFT_478586 [Jimgerdemannia flammicorona]
MPDAIFHQDCQEGRSLPDQVFPNPSQQRVPQQTNGSDCGVFLLYFARTFLMDPDYYCRILHENANTDAWNGETPISDTHPHIRDALSNQTDKTADSGSQSVNRPATFKSTQPTTISPESARIVIGVRDKGKGKVTQGMVPKARAPGYISAKCPSSTSARVGSCKCTKVDMPQMMDVDTVDASMTVCNFNGGCKRSHSGI